MFNTFNMGVGLSLVIVLPVTTAGRAQGDPLCRDNGERRLSSSARDRRQEGDAGVEPV